MIENKGDLISRETLKETIIKVCGKCSNNITEYDENNIPNGNCAIWHILNMIDNAPTVMPSVINIKPLTAEEKKTIFEMLKKEGFTIILENVEGEQNA